MQWLATLVPLLVIGCGRIGFDPRADSINVDAPAITASTGRLALGFNSTCLLRDDRTVQCWGNGLRGRLGTASVLDIGDDEPASAGTRVGLGGVATQIAAGADHACARLDTGGVRCWGTGDNGRLGYPGLADVGDDEVPATVGDVDVGGFSDEVAAAGAHTCARRGAGVRCWGQGAGGRLGLGNTATIGDDETPAFGGDVMFSEPPVQIDARGAHSCAVLAGGSVHCWGSNGAGQLGYGSTSNIGDDERADAVGPVDVGGPVLQIATGAAHTCALLEGGTVRCWGDATSGRLGYGNPAAIGDNETPAAAGDVRLGGLAIQVSAGATHTCALLVTGGVRCWGGNAFGQLGQANVNDIGDNEMPDVVPEISLGGRAVEVVAGGTHTCALLDTGAVRCWGDGSRGQLGYGNTAVIGDDETPEFAGDVPID